LRGASKGREEGERVDKESVGRNVRVGTEVNNRQALVLIKVSSRSSKVHPSNQRLNRPVLRTVRNRLRTLPLRLLSRRRPSNRDGDDALKTLERNTVHLGTAEKVEHERLELGEGRVGVPEGGVGLDSGEVEEGETADGGFDRLEKKKR
jgi:hypothetical protein